MKEWRDGEAEKMDEKEARKLARTLDKSVKHARPKGHPDDKLTADDPVPDDVGPEEGGN